MADEVVEENGPEYEQEGEEKLISRAVTGTNAEIRPPWLNDDDGFIRLVYRRTREIISKFIPDTHYVNKVLTARTLGIFCQAFIHETVDGTNNYEIYENLGDTIYGSCFKTHMMRSFPGRDESFYTEMKNHYVSKYVFSTYFDRLEFMDILKKRLADETIERLEINKLKTDVFEAFVGALITAGAMVHQEENSNVLNTEIGTLICANFLRYIIHEFENDEIKGTYPPKTTIIELFKFCFDQKTAKKLKYALSNPDFVMSASDIKIMLSKLKIEYTGKVEGFSNDIGRYYNSADYYGKVLEQLGSYGISREARDRAKITTMLQKATPETLSLLEFLKAINGISSIQYFTDGNQNSKIFRLVGIVGTHSSINLSISYSLDDLVGDWVNKYPSTVQDGATIYEGNVYMNGVAIQTKKYKRTGNPKKPFKEVVTEQEA